ncbi:MAG TPA: phage gp6-like head-tail connector protein [Paracoccus sp.]|nr:phage gp6-like head-tail connector protein [Paracoccus sp. (in: a-proteobacteria)]
MSLVSFESALHQLRRDPGEDDAGITEKLADAESWAIDVMGANYDPDWVEETVPGQIRQAILAYLSATYDDDKEGRYLDLAHRQIERWRDHTIA